MGLKGFLNNFPPCTQLFESAHLKFKKTTPLCTIIKPCLLITLKKKMPYAMTQKKLYTGDPPLVWFLLVRIGKI